MSVCPDCGYPFMPPHGDKNCGSGPLAIPPQIELELGKTYTTASGQHFRMETMCISPPDTFSGVSVAKHGDMPSRLRTAFKKDGTCRLLGKGSPFTLVALVEE